MLRARWIGAAMAVAMLLGASSGGATQIQNAYVGVSVSDTQGDFTIGGILPAVTLNFGWPWPGSTSWTHFWVDSSVFTNSPGGSGIRMTLDGPLTTVTFPADSLSALESATGSTDELRGTYSFVGGAVTC